MTSSPSSPAPQPEPAPTFRSRPRGSWLKDQQRELVARLREISRLDHIRVAQPFCRVDTEIDGVSVRWTSDAAFRQDPDYECDIYFNQGYQPDFARLTYVRNTGRALFHATWLWDNHHLFADSMHSSMLSDITFSAHGYASAYLRNEISLDGGFIPLCPVFWEDREVQAASEAALHAPRSDALYGGYNSYPEYPKRDSLLAAVRDAVPNNNIFTTPHGTPPQEHPFYGMSPHNRMLELMHYKVSLCAAFGKNTAMRIFDTLLAGGIPLLLGRPADLPSIFSEAEIEMLPVVVVDEFEPESLAAAHRHCLERFEEGGADGVARRSNFCRQHHMPSNRIALMVSRIRDFAGRADEIEAASAD